MSSILRALKKVQDDAPGKYEFRPWPRQREIKETPWRKLGRLRSGRIFFAAALILAVVAAIWFLFGAKKESPATIAHPAPLRSQSVMTPEKTDAAPSHPAVDGDMGAVSENRFGSPGNFQSPRSHAQGSEMEQGLSPMDSAKSDGNARPMPVSEENVPKLDDPSMTLQAIVWASNPNERVAVINGGFMGEGDKAGAFRVIAILRSSVLLRGNDDDMWRLTYKRR